MARVKLTNIQKKKIVADYINNQNYSETARMNNIKVESVRRIVKADEEFVKKSELKKQQDANDMLDYLASQQPLKERILKKLLIAIEKKSEDANINTLKELATAYGIILDKELKIIEMKRGNGSREDLMKVEELLAKLENEANK